MKVWRSGRVLDYRSKGSWFTPSLCYLVFSGHGALNVKLRTLEYFMLYLRNRQSGNLRAIESCVCSIRSIERNMMPFLRTVRDEIFFSALYCTNTFTNWIPKQFENWMPQNETLHQERSQDRWKTLESCDVQTFDNQVNAVVGAHIKE